MCIFNVRVLAVLSYRATLLSALSHLNLKMSGSRSLMVLLLWQLSIWVQLVVWWLCHLWTSVLIIEESFHPLHCWHKNTRILTWSSHGEILLNFPDRNFCQISPLDSGVFSVTAFWETENSTFIFHCHGCFCSSFKRIISFDSTSTWAECPHKSKIWRNDGYYICWILWFLCRWKASWHW